MVKQEKESKQYSELRFLVNCLNTFEGRRCNDNAKIHDKFSPLFERISELESKVKRLETEVCRIKIALFCIMLILNAFAWVILN